MIPAVEQASHYLPGVEHPDTLALFQRTWLRPEERELFGEQWQACRPQSVNTISDLDSWIARSVDHFSREELIARVKSAGRALAFLRVYRERLLSLAVTADFSLDEASDIGQKWQTFDAHLEQERSIILANLRNQTITTDKAQTMIGQRETIGLLMRLLGGATPVEGYNLSRAKKAVAETKESVAQLLGKTENMLAEIERIHDALEMHIDTISIKAAEMKTSRRKRAL